MGRARRFAEQKVHPGYTQQVGARTLQPAEHLHSLIQFEQATICFVWSLLLGP